LLERCCGVVRRPEDAQNLWEGNLIGVVNNPYYLCKTKERI
jgi:hypothetical protein